MIRHTFDDLLDELAEKVDPFWQDCQTQKANLRTFFVSNSSAIANALLEITDGRIKEVSSKISFVHTVRCVQRRSSILGMRCLGLLIWSASTLLKIVVTCTTIVPHMFGEDQ